MAYKVSFGDYSHSGSLTATSDLTASVNVSGATGTFGTLNATTFNPATLSTTTLTATTASITRLSGAAVSSLSGNYVPSWDSANGQLVNSFMSVNPVSGSTTVSGSGGLIVSGTLGVNGAISSSVGVSSSAGQFGTLTVTTLNPTNLTVAGNVVVSGNTQLGDANTDTVSFTAKSNTNIIPTGAVNLGSTADLWNNVYANTLSASAALTASSALVGNGLTVNAGGMQVTGGVVLNNGLNVGTNLTVVGNTILSGNTTVGDANTDTVAVLAKVSTTVLPTGTVDLGGTAVGTQWANVYATNISSSGNVIVGGNLTVNGTTTTVNSTTLEITDKNIVIASGSNTTSLANGSGITLGTTTYQFQFVSSSFGAKTNYWQVSSSTDGMTDFKAGNVFATLNGNVIQQANNVGDSNATASLGINYTQTNFTGPHTWVLPNTPVVGNSIKIKAPHNCNGTNTLTISASIGAIDYSGNTTVVLSSPDAAVELVYVDSVNSLWKMF